MLAQVEASNSKKVQNLMLKMKNEFQEIGQRFEILDEMTTVPKNGDVRAMIVTGFLVLVSPMVLKLHLKNKVVLMILLVTGSLNL